MPFRSQPQRLVPFSECKSTAFLHNHQTFFALFSRPFWEKYAHFMHKALKNSRFTPRKNFSTFWTADCKCEKKIRLLQGKGLQIAPNMLNNIFIALRTPQSPRPPHKTHLARPHHALPPPRARRCRKNASSTAPTACRAAGSNNGKPWNRTQMPWEKASTAGELSSTAWKLSSTASIFGMAGDGLKEMLRKFFYVRREFFDERRDIFYVHKRVGRLLSPCQ